MARIRDTTLDLIRQFEGLELLAYPDGKGYSIGYGAQTYENGANVQRGQTITKERAEQLLTHHVNIAAAVVNRYVSSPLSQNQFDALVSFAYNVGAGNFAGSTLLKVVNLTPNNFNAIQVEFAKWNKSNGVTLPGLVERRQAEALIYGQSTYLKSTNWLAIVAVAAGAFGVYKVGKSKKIF